MTGRRCQGTWSRLILTIAVVIGFGNSDAFAVVDLNGKWDVTITTPGGPIPQNWFIAQSGSTLSQIGPYTGTIDTGTGAMSFGGTYFGAGCVSGGGPDSWTGTAAGDSNSFTASGTMYLPRVRFHKVARRTIRGYTSSASRAPAPPLVPSSS